MDAHSVLTTVATVLLLGALGAGVYVWLTFARWSERRLRGQSRRLRTYEALGAIRGRDDPATTEARRAFVRALALFGALVLVAVALLELRAVL